MKKLLLGVLFLALSTIFPNPTMAGINISIGISLPPLIAFQAPPEVIVIPDTNYVYAVPDINVDLYFWNGWWWRLWNGRWYRSEYYDRGWGYYNNVPSFYFDVNPRWRSYYRDRNWYGHRWDYQRIPNRQLQQNWQHWENNRNWERENSWGVQNYQPRPQYKRRELQRQRQKAYQQRPEVKRAQQPQRRQQPQVQRSPRQVQPQQQRQQPQYRQNKGISDQKQPQGKPDRRGTEHRR
jgi:hypothetical protein